MSYNYRVRISSNTGEVKNSDCECPAGKGPYGTCKHVAAVCLLLIKFRETRTIAIPRGCTENLQTFHKPKKSFQVEQSVLKIFYSFIYWFLAQLL